MIAVIAYVYRQKTMHNVLAENTDFEVMIRIGEVEAEASGSKRARLLQG